MRVHGIRILQAAFPGLLPVDGCDFLAYSCAAARELHPLPCLCHGAKTRKPKDISKNRNSGVRNLAGRPVLSQIADRQHPHFLGQKPFHREERKGFAKVAKKGKSEIRALLDFHRRIAFDIFLAITAIVSGLAGHKIDFVAHNTGLPGGRQKLGECALPGLVDA